MTVNFEQEYLYDLYTEGKTKDKKHRFQLCFRIEVTPANTLTWIVNKNKLTTSDYISSMLK